MQESTTDIDLSIVIVNYNVKEFLANLLKSIEKARHNLQLEIFVVDNASTDGSLEYLEPRFPHVNFIANQENVGFGKANNQAIERARGRYTLLINPDTIVSEDTLTTLYQHMEKNPDCGASGCKILNPDGSFAPESRRSVPTIWSSMCKVLGLSAIFPNSKTFGQYYLSWKDQDESSQVPVLSGSFMFFRTSVLKELEGFDQRFFMYGEDIDLCYRLNNETDYHIDYVAETSIIHYKGESTKKDDLGYIKNFNKALYLFFNKHYTYRYSLLFRSMIYLGIILRAVISFVKTKLQIYKGVLFDLLILNFIILAGFAIRYGIGLLDIFDPDNLNFLWINGLTSLLYIGFSNAFGVLRKEGPAIVGSLKALMASYAGVVLITFFIRQLAFSRLIFLGSGVVSLVVIGGIRLIRRNRARSLAETRGKFRPVRIFIIGLTEQTDSLIQKLRTKVEWNYDIVGVVSGQQETDRTEVENIPIVGTVKQLPELIRSYRIDQLFFLLHGISYKEMLGILSRVQDEQVIAKLIPDDLDFILGKSHVQYLADIPLVDLELTYRNPWNRLVKRSLELIVSFIMVSILGLPALLGMLFTGTEKEPFRLLNGNKNTTLNFYSPAVKHRWKNWAILWWNVLRGRLRMVGAPLEKRTDESDRLLEYGLTSLVQVNRKRVQTAADREQFDAYYLQNYSIWLDLEILIKTFMNGPGPLEMLSGLEKTEPSSS